MSAANLAALTRTRQLRRLHALAESALAHYDLAVTAGQLHACVTDFVYRVRAADGATQSAGTGGPGECPYSAPAMSSSSPGLPATWKGYRTSGEHGGVGAQPRSLAHAQARRDASSAGGLVGIEQHVGFPGPTTDEQGARREFRAALAFQLHGQVWRAHRRCGAGLQPS